MRSCQGGEREAAAICVCARAEFSVQYKELILELIKWGSTRWGELQKSSYYKDMNYAAIKLNNMRIVGHTRTSLSG